MYNLTIHSNNNNNNTEFVALDKAFSKYINDMYVKAKSYCN